MATFTYQPFIAIEQTTAKLLPNAVGNLYDPVGDPTLSTPVTVTDMNGNSITNIPANADGVVASFTSTFATLYWRSGTGTPLPVVSVQQYLDAATDAQTSADASATAAAASAIAAEAAQSAAAGAVQTVNGIAPDTNGNVNVSGGGSGGTIGIGNVVGLQDALDAKVGDTDPVNASQVNAGTGVINAAHLGTGTGSSSNFLRGDGTWAVPAGGGGGGTGTVDTVNGIGPDGSGNVTLSSANIGLGNVNNTSDANKPVSTAQASAIAAKATDSAVVHLANAESISGVKTFSVSPVVPDSSFTIAKTSGLSTSLSARPQVVSVSTGSEARPSGSTVVMWIAASGYTGAAPTAMVTGDIWFAQAS